MAASLRSFRLVCAPQQRESVEALLRAEGYVFAPEPFSPWCRVLLEEPRPLGGSLAAFFGCIYIQNRSSMLPPLALLGGEEGQGQAVLDMCASPGGKTGFAAQLTGAQGFVLGNELSHSRLATLRENLHSLGMVHAATCSYEGQALPLREGSWQRIQLDPPCSGWGTEEKNPQVRKVWHGEKIRPLVSLQRQLLTHAARLLAPGGVVVYSTCTTNEDENEAQVRWAVEELGLVCEPLPPFDGFFWEAPTAGAEGTLRVDGARSGAQGFYIARLRKPLTSFPVGDVAPAAASACPDARRRTVAASPSASGELPRSVLEDVCADPGLLPPGRIVVFNNTARFVPEAATPLLTPALRWQAAPLGRYAGGRVHLSPRQRALLPLTPPPDALVLDDVAGIRAILQGQRVDTALRGRDTGLYWRDLPLGRVGLKNGRVVWSNKSL